jgi:hypothetical protein
VSWLGRLVAGLSTRKPESDLVKFHMIFAVGRVALGQIFLRVLLFPAGSIIPPVLHSHLHLHVAVNKRETGDVLDLQNEVLFVKSGSGRWNIICTFLNL